MSKVKSEMPVSKQLMCVGMIKFCLQIKKGKQMSMEKDSFQHQREGNVMAKVKSTYYSVDSLFQGQIDTSMISYKYKGQKMCTYDQSLSSGMKYACI